MLGHRLLSVLLLLATLAAIGCEQQPPEGEEPPEWVKEAHERSRKQRIAGPKSLPEPAKDPAPPADLRDQTSPIERSLLWRVEGPNGPLYLFGTVHGGIADLEWDDFPQEVHRAIDDSEAVVLEADTDAVDPMKIQRITTLPADKSLRKILGEEHFQTLVAKTSTPARVLDRLQPWVAYAELSREAIGDGRPVDEVVKVEARVKKLDIIYLETVIEQLELLHSLVDAGMVREMLSDMERQDELLARTLAAYKKGDTEGLAKVFLDPESLEKYPKFHDKFLVQRNRNWIPKLEKLTERGNVFVAVGAGHLVGDNSVTKMLEAKGYEVERVAPSNGSPSEE